LVKSQDLQETFNATTGQITISIDLGDRFNHRAVEADEKIAAPLRY
jgi:hypothetical protein